MLLSAMLLGRAPPELSMPSSISGVSQGARSLWGRRRGSLIRSGDCDRLLGKDVFIKSGQEAATERGSVRAGSAGGGSSHLEGWD